MPQWSRCVCSFTSHDYIYKYHLILEHFVPAATYKFPQASNRRSFQHSWLLKYQWLRYSKQDDGGYYLPCVLFFRLTVNFRPDPGVLVTKPLNNFQKALEILNKHEGKHFLSCKWITLSKLCQIRSPVFRDILTRPMNNKLLWIARSSIPLLKRYCFVGNRISLFKDIVTASLMLSLLPVHNMGIFGLS